MCSLQYMHAHLNIYYVMIIQNKMIYNGKLKIGNQQTFWIFLVLVQYLGNKEGKTWNYCNLLFRRYLKKGRKRKKKKAKRF